MSCVVPNKSPRNFSRNKQTFIPVSYRNHQSSASGRVDNTIPVQEKLLHIWLQSLFNYKHIFSFSGCPPERKQGNERERCIFIPFPIAPLYKKKKAHRTDALPSITFVSLQFLFSLFILPQYSNARYVNIFQFEF